MFDAFVNLFKGQTDGMTATILTFTVGILMALAGVFSLFRLQKTARAWIGVLIFIVALVNMILTVIQFSGLSALGTCLTQVAISWLFIVSD